MGSYDLRYPLIIDPGILVYSGFVGGSGEDVAYAIAVDSVGNAYLTGYVTSGVAFPTVVGPDSSYNGGVPTFFGDGNDAFVAKVSPSGVLMYCGYLGGSGNEAGVGIAVDSSGIAYIAGETSSTQATFPEGAGPDSTYNGGDWDGFIARVAASGSTLNYCAYRVA